MRNPLTNQDVYSEQNLFRKMKIINILENFYRELYYSEEELGNEDSEENDVMSQK